MGSFLLVWHGVDVFLQRILRNNTRTRFPAECQKKNTLGRFPTLPNFVRKSDLKWAGERGRGVVPWWFPSRHSCTSSSSRIKTSWSVSNEWYRCLVFFSFSLKITVDQKNFFSIVRFITFEQKTHILIVWGCNCIWPLVSKWNLETRGLLPTRTMVQWFFFVCVIYCYSKVFMVQATRLYSLICNLTYVKSSVVQGPGPVVRRCSPQSLPDPAPRRPPTHTSDSAPIDVHPTPTSLQFRVLYTYVRMHLYILGA